MTDDVDEYYERFNVGGGFLSEYHPLRHVDEDILHGVDDYKISDIVEQDEAIAVAANSIEGLEIEVYERRSHSFFEAPKRVLGLLDDYILHVDYKPRINSGVAEDANAAFLTDNYFGFNKEDYHQVEEFLNKFSDDQYDTFLRAKDLQ